MKLRPVGVDKGTIKMNVARLMKLNQDPSLGEMYARGAVFAEGDWSFEIPFENSHHKSTKSIKKSTLMASRSESINSPLRLPPPSSNTAFKISREIRGWNSFSSNPCRTERIKWLQICTAAILWMYSTPRRTGRHFLPALTLLFRQT